MKNWIIPGCLVLIGPMAKAELRLDDMIVLSNSQHTFNINHQTESQQTVGASLYGLTNADRLEMLADYVSGVHTGRLGGGTGSDVSIRGFSLGGRLLLDGVLDNQNYFVRDPSTLERVEFITARNGVLYGAGAPTGTVNYISKKPQLSSQHSLQASTGNNAYRRMVVDNTAAFESSQSWAWRSVLAAQKADDWKKHIHNDSYNWLGAVSRIKADSRIDLTAELSRQQRPFDFDNVWISGKPVYDVSYVMPASTADRRHQRMRFDGSWHLTDHTSITSSAQWWRSQREETQAGFWFLSAAETPMLGYYQEVDESFRQRSARAELNTGFETRLPQLLTLGIDYHNTQTDWENPNLNYFSAGPFFFLDPLQPDYTQPMPTVDQLYLRTGKIRYSEHSLFALHRQQLPKGFTLSNGARQAWFNLQVADTSIRQRPTQSRAKAKPLLFSHALQWQGQGAWAAHLSWNESFMPNSGQDASGSLFEPLQGEQSEFGITWRQSQHHLATNLYRARQRNLLMPDPDNPGYRKPLGSLETQGFEVLAGLQWYSNWSTELRYNHFLHTRINSTQSNDGKHFASIPRHSGSVRLNLQPIQNWTVMLGVTAQSSRPLDSNNSAKVPGYTRLDGGLKWQSTQQTALAFSLRNIENKSYVSYSSGRDYLRFGEPRTLRATLTHQL